TIPNIPDPTIPNIPDPTIPVNSTPQSDYLTYAIIGGVIVAAVMGVAAIIRIKQKTVKPIHDQQTIQKTETTDTETTDTETIFKLKPDLREDDKEIVRFISNNGGQVLESELRKKFLQPRTTMWRAVKRLERNGVVEIEKKDLQNLVKLRKNMEEEK
ncbi:MAG: MarR family transcriptional regulator, partial [Nitrosopumilus sp.]|nr:MarR family transcriptional regulator [Nitrosopumilus sp.]